MPSVGSIRIGSGGTVQFSGAQGGAGNNQSATTQITAFSVTSPAGGIALYDSATVNNGSIILALRNLVAGDNISIVNSNGQLLISSNVSLGTMGQQSSNNVDITGGSISATLLDMGDNTITNVANPVNGSDAATKTYVENVSINFSIPGKPATAQIIQVGLPRAVQLVFGSGNPFTYCISPAVSSTVFTLQYVRSSITTVIGTITFHSSATSATLSSPTTINFLAGDVLQLVTPSVQDSSLGDVVITVVVIRE